MVYSINTFLPMVINALFTGIGTSAGLYFFKRYMEPTIELGHTNVMKVSKVLSNPIGKLKYKKGK